MLTASLEKLDDLMKEYELKPRQTPKQPGKASPLNADDLAKSSQQSGPVSPMETDEMPTPGQLLETKIVSGVVTSAPVSPLGKDKSDKYEDLSESGEEN